MENSNDIKSIDIEERLNPSLTNATVNIVTYTFRMKYGKKYMFVACAALLLGKQTL